MWLSVEIEKRVKGDYDFLSLVEDFDLDYGVIGYRPVVVDRRFGRYTRLIPKKRYSSAMEVEDSEDHFELILSIPCADEDVRLFFKLVERYCHIAKANFFKIEDALYSLEFIDDVRRSYYGFVRDVLKKLCEEFKSGREGFLAYGSLFPVVMGPADFKEIDGLLSRYVRIFNRYQSLEALFVSPTIFSLKSLKRDYGAYELFGYGSYIVPYDPMFLCNYEPKGAFEFIVDFGFGAIRYEDFMSLVSKREVFDEEHLLVNLSFERRKEMVGEYGYDPLKGEVTGRPYWGRMFLEGYSHELKILSKGFDLPLVNGYNHLSVFLRWVYEHDHFSREFKDYECALIERIGECKKDLRAMVRNDAKFGGQFKLFMFDGAVRDFVAKGLVDSYLDSVDAYALSVFGQDRYDCLEFDDEAYLFVDFDEDMYAFLSGVLDGLIDGGSYAEELE